MKKDFRIPPAQTSSGIPQVIVVSGSDYEMGYQYGKQLAEKIYSTAAVIKASIFPVNGADAVTNDMIAERYYAEKYIPGLLTWHQGTMDACKDVGYDITLTDLMLLTTFTSAFYGRPGDDYPEEIGLKIDEEKAVLEDRRGEKHFCNSVGVSGTGTTDGEPLVFSNGGSSYEMLERIILIGFPENGPNFITFPTIGKYEDQAGMNSSGFSWAMTGNCNGGPSWGVMPELSFHYLSQLCTSPEEAQEWIKSIPRVGAFANYIMSDIEGNVSVLEANDKVTFVRKPGHLGETADFVINTNHFASPETVDLNIELDGRDWKEWNFNSITRYATAWEYISEAAQKKEVSVELIRKMLHSDDWYDPVSKTWHYNEPGEDFGFNYGFDGFDYTQACVFKPASMMAYFMAGTGSGTGMPANSTGEFVHVKLEEDPMSTALKMQEIAFDLFVKARNSLRKELNKNEYLKENYQNRVLFEEMLDEAFKEYEMGRDRVSFAYIGNSGDLTSQEEHNALLSEAMSHHAKAQLFAQIILSEVKEYNLNE